MTTEDIDQAIRILLDKFDVRKVGSSKEHSRVFDGAMMALVCLREALEQNAILRKDGDPKGASAEVPPD